jgi:hypothetical protein
MQTCRSRESAGPTKRIRLSAWIVLGTAFALLPGCSEEKLDACVASTEPTLLLRQLTLSGDKKKGFEGCLAGTAGRNFCRIIYLDADNALTQCMSEKGYAFRSGASDCNPYFNGYYESECYAPTWLWKIRKLIGAQISN